MTIVTLNKNKIKKIVGKVDDKKLDHILNMFGTCVEKMNENEIDVEITPNRPDMLSQQGVERALSTFSGKKIKEYKIFPAQKKYNVTISSSLKNIRPFTACAIIKNIKFDDERIKEVIEIQEKLHATVGRGRKKLAIGIYPLEKIKLPIKFEAREPDRIKFIPLEMNQKMNGFQILQRHPVGQKYAHLLKGKAKFPIFVDAEGKILSMPPIINSHDTGKITKETKNIFIECSGFEFETLNKILNILVTMFADMGGKVYAMKLKYGNKIIKTPNLKSEKIKINLDYVNKILGLNLKEREIKKYLKKMGYSYSKGKVSIPPWRTDILHEIDLVEDIAIAYGYDNFSLEIPEIATIGEEDKKEQIKRKIVSILSNLKMEETVSSILTNKKNQFEKMNLKKTECIETENAKTEYNILKKDLIHSSLKILSENTDSEYPQKIFEIGKTFEKGDSETGIIEEDKLVVLSTPGNFTDAKQILQYLSEMLNKKFRLEQTTHQPFINGRTGKIFFNNKEIGYIGEIHPLILKKWHIKMPVSGFEISLQEIFENFDKN